MRDLKTLKITQEHQESQLRFADNYQLSQTIENHNRTDFDWRNLLNPFNRSRRP